MPDPAAGPPPDSPPNPEPAVSQTGTTGAPVDQGVDHQTPVPNTPATPTPVNDQNSIDSLLTRLTTELNAIPEKVASSVRQAMDVIPTPKADPPAVEPVKVEGEPGGSGESNGDGKSWLVRKWFG